MNGQGILFIYRAPNVNNWPVGLANITFTQLDKTVKALYRTDKIFAKEFKSFLVAQQSLLVPVSVPLLFAGRNANLKYTQVRGMIREKF